MEIVFALISMMGLVMIIVGIGYINSGLKEIRKLSRIINRPN